MKGSCYTFEVIIEHFSFGVAFFAGLVSFLSPCTLPILPSFLSYLAGVSLHELAAKRARFVLMVHALAFALGFMAVFVVVGASIGFLGKTFLLNQLMFQRVGGLLLILLGLHLAGVFRFSSLMRERRFRFPDWSHPLVYGRSFLVGVVFAFGWAPCYGPITGAILTLLATHGTVERGVWLMGWYALGFVVPFVVTALFADRMVASLRSRRRALLWLQRCAGGFIVLLGVLLATNRFSFVVNFLIGHYTQWEFWQFN